MLKRFFPKAYVDSVFAVDYKALYQQGYRAVIFDIDNTLAPYHVRHPSAKTTGLLKRLVRLGFGVCLLSNNKEARVAEFNKSLNLAAVHRAGKPGVKGVSRALEELSSTPETTVLIGDQLFTDIWCGNRKGLLTILVKPISNRDEWTVRPKRGLERLVLKSYLKAQNEPTNYILWTGK